MAEDDRVYCPLMVVDDADGRLPRECAGSYCGFWHEASDPQYSRCAIAEIARQVLSIRFVLDSKNGGRSKGKGKGKPPV